MIYSPQMLNTFQECPVKYYYRFVKNIIAPTLDSKFLVGKNIHALASYYLKAQDISMYELNDNEVMMWNNLKSCKYFSYSTKMVESTVACNVSGNWIGGRLDALVAKDEDYYILDYKTGEIPNNAKYNYQTIVYLMSCDKLISNYKSLNFVYLNVRTGEEEIITFSDTLNQEYEDKLTNIINDIVKLSVPIPHKNQQCLRCSYAKMCL